MSWSGEILLTLALISEISRFCFNGGKFLCKIGLDISNIFGYFLFSYTYYVIAIANAAMTLAHIKTY
jgi:hypothetical protein